MSLAGLQQMKREGKKIVAVVAWDYQIAQIADRAGVDLVSVGDSVGVNLWGQQEGEITLDEMLIVCKAVRRGVKRALVSCDLPKRENADAAMRLVEEGGADLVKLFASPELVRAVAQATKARQRTSSSKRSIWNKPARRFSISAIPGPRPARRSRRQSRSRCSAGSAAARGSMEGFEWCTPRSVTQLRI